MFKDLADVVVCDGFIWNIALKVAEGTFDFVRTILSEEIKGKLIPKLGYFLQFSVISADLYKMDQNFILYKAQILNKNVKNIRPKRKINLEFVESEKKNVNLFCNFWRNRLRQNRPDTFSFDKI